MTFHFHADRTKFHEHCSCASTTPLHFSDYYQDHSKNVSNYQRGRRFEYFHNLLTLARFFKITVCWQKADKLASYGSRKMLQKVHHLSILLLLLLHFGGFTSFSDSMLFSAVQAPKFRPSFYTELPSLRENFILQLISGIGNKRLKLSHWNFLMQLLQKKLQKVLNKILECICTPRSIPPNYHQK